ncbi:protein of unknown function (plasmid) [Agreia sp. COWG]|nr:protein of unknown function [Agreia sp. COWG]
MAARRRPWHSSPDQPELGIWGLSPESADQVVADTRDAPVTSHEKALIDGQLSFDQLWDEGADADELIRDAGNEPWKTVTPSRLQIEHTPASRWCLLPTAS